MAEKEYIEREALINWLTTPTGFKTNCEDCTSIDCLDCIVGEAIQNIPAADVAPIRHGKWILKSAGDVHSYFECSECHRVITAHNNYFGQPTEHAAQEYPYCNCGARMDGE